jgi:hypothetical protein
VSSPTAVLLAVGWVTGWLLAGRRHSLRTVVAPSKPADLSVIVPARDEELRLPHLLDGLEASVPSPTEVLVVDDGSTDATAFLAHQGGARVIAVEPPPGWTGKAWACERGADEAAGQVLIFLDADTEPDPGAIAALAAAAGYGELVSVQPRHRVERAYERLSAGPALVSLLGAGTGGPPRLRWWRRPLAFGPAIAVPRELYRRLGGHAAARSDIAEDVALARAADRAGIPVRSFLGDDRIGYRMYPEGLGRLVEGWTKNLATGAGATPPLRLVATILWVAAALQAPALLVATPSLLAVAVYVAFVAQVGVLLRRVGRFGPATTVAYPVVLLAFVALFARSVVVTAGRRAVPWRGRYVPVRT